MVRILASNINYGFPDFDAKYSKVEFIANEKKNSFSTIWIFPTHFISDVSASITLFSGHKEDQRLLLLLLI